MVSSAAAGSKIKPTKTPTEISVSAVNGNGKGKGKGEGNGNGNGNGSGTGARPRWGKLNFHLEMAFGSRLNYTLGLCWLEGRFFGFLCFLCCVPL